ncbi:MAG TPA: glycine betaine ABC transporter substrate-binding protein [Thermoanaerobaculia bacterium]|nr:glycine betaine ABC transporter substrate-binding protein [Thermoanaerobaculia bacterium]
MTRGVGRGRHARLHAAAGLAAGTATLALALLLASPVAAETLVVGSKNFEESRFLAELFAQAIESRDGLTVERRLGLAGTQFCFEALRTGAIDLYPEYTGTGLVSILGREPAGSAAATLTLVRREFLARFDLVWLAPLGFENSWELTVPQRLAEAKGLGSISDLARVAGRLRAGFDYEFIERPDGLPGLERTYGLRFGSVQGMQQALKYQALAGGRLDVIDAYTTDGRLLVHDLVVLDDDRGFFPPYEAAPLVRAGTLERHPGIAVTLALVAGALDGDVMRAANLRLQEHGEPEAAVARDVLRSLGIDGSDGEDTLATASGAGARGGGLDAAAILELTGEHLALSLGALAVGIAVAVPLGLLLERRRGSAEAIIRLIGTSQTIPSLALLGFLIPLLGVGVLPSLVALWLYSLFPILRATFSGVRDADPGAVEAATALGMTDGQVLRRVRLPLAVPAIMAGVRTAGVIIIGTATLAAFIGAGGLGEPIIAGVQLLDTRRILSGAIPAALLAIAVDAGLGALERALAPRGLRP